MIGAVAGAILPIDTKGIDFAMTALFIVIAVEQWTSYSDHLPAILGAVFTLVSLTLVGADNMLLPALGAIVLALLCLRKHLEQKENHAHTEEKGEPPC